MNKIRVLSLFSGIGAYEEALYNLNVPYELVNYCENNDIAAKAYSIIHNISEDKNLGDITKVNEKEISDFDLMTYSFPCQDLSALGNQDGLFDKDGNKTRSGLFYDAIRIAKEKKPKFLIAENVRDLANKKFKNELHNMIEYLETVGYKSYYMVLNSKNYGIPHSRNRIYIVSIRRDINKGFYFPNTIPLTTKASDYYDDFATDDHYLRESDMKYLNEFRLKKKYSSLNADIIICQTTKQGNLTNPQNFVKDDKGYRVMTSRELLALQGFKKEYADKLLSNGITKEQIGKLSGNSVTVNVLVEIFKELMSTYSVTEEEKSLDIVS